MGAGGSLRRRVRTVPPEAGFALALAVVVLGPMLRPGYPLRYDLVSVPRPVLGPEALGLGDRVPRAIPLDAVTAVLARVWPDAWLTQAIGLLVLTMAGWGAGRLVDGPLPGRLLAVLVAIWNPFVMEQLAIGHLPHLAAYAAVPWIVRGAATGHLPGPVLATGLGSITPGGGLLCAVAAVVGLIAAGPGIVAQGRRRPVLLLGAVAVLQLPWLVAAIAHPGLGGTTSPTVGLSAFGVRAETSWGRVVDVLGLGGMWNGSAVPTSRSTVLAQCSTVLLLGLAVAGTAWLVRHGRWCRWQWVAAALAAAVGYGVALLPVLPGGGAALALLVESVPGAGLLRDGHRWLALPAMVLAVLAGHAAAWVRAPQRRAGVVLAALLVVATMPDLAFGLAGRLQAAQYPPGWATVRAQLDAAPDDSRVLVLPWQTFRRFAWTGPEAVLDPAPRYLPRPVVVSDALIVGGTGSTQVTLPEEGPVARQVASLLATDRLGDQSLRALGVGWVMVERGTPGPLPRLPAWPVAHEDDTVLLLRAPGEMPRPPVARPARRAAVLGAHTAAGFVLCVAGAALLRPGRLRTVTGLRRRNG